MGRATKTPTHIVGTYLLVGMHVASPLAALPQLRRAKPDCAGSLDVQLKIPLRLLAKITFTA